MEKVVLDNSGKGPLLVPGFNDIPLTYELPCQDRFAHGFDDWCQIPAITARELALVGVINKITDEAEWHHHLHDAAVVARWKAEAMARDPLISEKTWEWCLAELIDKAVDLKQTGLVQVLDTGSLVCKSDSLLSESFTSDLKHELQGLFATSPSTGAIERIIVDPRHHPLIYGQTKILSDGGVVKLPRNGSPIESMAVEDELMEAAPLQPDSHYDYDEVSEWIDRRREDAQLGHNGSVIDSDRYFWSSRYQCLPCDVNFVPGGLRIDSYINGLHPRENTIYESLEDIMKASLEMWNDCLLKGQTCWTNEYGANQHFHQTQRGRCPLRIITFGPSWQDTLPNWAASFDTQRRDQIREYQIAKRQHELNPKARDQAVTSAQRQDAENKLIPLRRSYLEGVTLPPDLTDKHWKLAEQYLKLPPPGQTQDVILDVNWRDHVWALLQLKAADRRYWEHPEPGTAFSYEDWRAGRGVDRAVVDMISEPLPHPLFAPRDVRYATPTHTPYSVDLHSFNEHGLQIFVEIGSNELKPGQQFQDEWHVTGHKNEHIVATAVFISEMLNTSSQISFQQETRMWKKAYRLNGHCPSISKNDDSSAYNYDPRSKHEDSTAMKELYGLGELSMQRLGSVQMRQGRLITYSNTMEHQMRTELIDTTRPGHCQYVKLHLVDPHYRICSTKNVVPQQSAWWADTVAVLLMAKGLPREVAQQIAEYVWPDDGSNVMLHETQMKEEQEWADWARRCEMRSLH